MLCFEGISLMLNIFNGRNPSPQYRLAAPPNGKLQSMTVHKEVGILEGPGWHMGLNASTDYQNTALCLWCYFTKHKIYPSKI